MYEDKPRNKIFALVLDFLSEHLIWIIIIALILIWWFFPDITSLIGQIVIFWAPVIALICGLIIALGSRGSKARRDREQGVSQYDIVITAIDFYLIDILIYLGTILILALAFMINNYIIDIVDLLQALIYFLTTNWIKRIFYNKILK